MPRFFMPRKRKRRGNRKAEEGDPPFPAVESTKVSRFYDLIDGITIKVHCSPTRQPYNLGSFQINSFKDEIILPAEFSMKFDPDGICFILLEERTDSKIDVYEGTYEGIPYDVLQLLPSLNIFCFYLHSSKLVERLFMEIYFDSSKFIALKEASDPVCSRHKSSMQKILQFFLDIKLDVYDGGISSEENDIAKIYSCIRNSYNPELSSEFSHEALIPQLRPYQCQAVSWMLKREKENSYNISCSDLHQLYIAITLKDGYTLYFHKYGGFIVNKKYAPESPCRGGLLADEMGLGKTLEVLACILKNPRPRMERENNNVVPQEIPKEEKLSDKNLNIEQEYPGDLFVCSCGDISKCNWIARCVICKITQHPRCMFYNPVYNPDYICPYCLEKYPVSSRATLIISPSSILHQWKEEISKHVKKDNMKVFIYKGVEATKYVHQEELADNDIVLLSYETLQRELTHVNIMFGRAGHSLRNTKKFLSIPSPLSTVEWWRICLDEAQMVESISTKVAIMVGKLNCINRWCVTGTPIKRYVSDLYGLFLFLDVKPFNHWMWYLEGIKKPFDYGNYEALTSALSSMTWATMKYQVFNQIGMCEVKEETKNLKFSPIEKVHYDNNYSDCIGAFIKNLRGINLDIDVQRFNKTHLYEIISPLKDLLRICCHFQIVHESLDSRITMNRIHHPMMSTTELLNKLLKTKTYECEQIHRQYIMASNALAGIYLIQKDYAKAVEIFQKSLESIEDNKKHIRTDVTQKIHCLFHLSNALKLAEKEGKIVECELNPSELDEKVKELSESYFEKSRIEVSSCKIDYSKIRKTIEEDFKKVNLKKKPFPLSTWCYALLELLPENQRKVFLDKLREVLDKAISGSSLKKNLELQRSVLALSSVPAFLDLLLRWTSDLYKEREKLLALMEDLAQEPNYFTVQSAINCHLRPVTGSPKCKFCTAEEVFESYENKLYVIEETTSIKHLENNGTEEIVTRNRKHPSGPLEICLEQVHKCLVLFYKDSKDRDLYEAATCDGYNELHLLITFKKEFQVLRNVWKKYYDFVSERDQIEMAKISMTLIPANEIRTESSASYCLYSHEVGIKKIQFQSDTIEFKSRLKTKLGQLHYLKNLEKLENKDAPFEEVCPVCQNKIESAWYVLQCGHCFCVPCTQQLLEERNVADRYLLNRYKGLSCPCCREFSPSSSLNIVSAKNEEESHKISLKNFYSTKLNAVIRCLLRIEKEEPTAKSLVFCSFPAVLQILSGALAENRFCFLKLNKGSKFQETLYKFKNDKQVKALLIPLHDGYSGLNLTEASHVLFLEPVIESSLELQAIGRAHRFGQTKQVILHKFIIMNSIEEDIQRVTSSSKNGEDVLKLKDLKNLFQQ